MTTATKFPNTPSCRRILTRRWRRAESLLERAKRASKTLTSIQLEHKYTLTTQEVIRRRKTISDAIVAAIYLADHADEVTFADLQFSKAGWRQEKDRSRKWYPDQSPPAKDSTDDQSVQSIRQLVKHV